MITINVTQDHIDKGERCRAFKCPVALATIDAFGDDKVEYVGVCYNAISVHFKDKTKKCYNITPDIINFLESFDKNINPLPFSFDLGGDVGQN